MFHFKAGQCKRRSNRHFSRRLHAGMDSRVPFLEALESRDLLSGTSLVGVQSTQSELFVESLFEGLLQRPADSLGLSYWSGVLQQGAPADLVVLAFENTPEVTGRVVDELYSTYLHRQAGGGDRAFWINFLEHGGAIEQMQATFLGSAEFSANLGNSDAFLEALYENALSRDVDGSGRQLWNQALAGGMSRAAVAANIVFSGEAHQLFVQGLYARFLGRTGDSSELQGWAQAMSRGETQEQVFAQIAGSSESINMQAAGILSELASGTGPGGTGLTQRLFVQFKPGTATASILDALQWIDGTLDPGSPAPGGSTPTVLIVDVSGRRTLGNATQLLQQYPDVAFAQPDLSSISSVDGALAWLQQRSTSMIQASSVPMAGGATAFLPLVGSHYDAFWLRDFAYMLEGNIGAFSNQQLEADGQLFINSMRWDGAGVDSVGLNGTPFYQPDSGHQGTNPVADGCQFTIDVVWRIYQRTGDLSFVVRNLVALEKCVAAVPVDPINGLVYDDSTRSGYGFTDLVPKTGDDLFCSLLLIRAERQLADLFKAVGAPDVATTWQASASRLVDAVRSVFWNPQTGLFMAATLQCNQPDIWGSAFAVYLGVATPEQWLAIGNYFLNHYSEIVYHGQLRELPGGTYWQNMPGPRDQYQNGGYWGTPMGWFVYTLDKVSPQMADQTILSMVQDYYVNGVHENVYGDSGWGLNYNSSVTLPIAGIEAMLQNRQNGGG
jgi:hypothetical protein